MTARDRRKVLLAIAVFAVLGILSGAGYAYLHRNDTICRDGKPPIQQNDNGLGQIMYRCQNGQIVTDSD